METLSSHSKWRVLVHSIGPNGVYANVIGVSDDRIQVKYYDARDGGDIVRWVSRGEVLTMPGDFPSLQGEKR